MTVMSYISDEDGNQGSYLNGDPIYFEFKAFQQRNFILKITYNLCMIYFIILISIDPQSVTLFNARQELCGHI